MSAALWIGYCPTSAIPAPTKDHLQLVVGGAVALALAVDPQDAGVESGVLAWATDQNDILTTYAKVADVLPVQLGAVFSNETALVDHVAAHRRFLDAAAARLAGHVEYGLHVRAAPPAPDTTGHTLSGRAFLAQRQQRRHRHRTLDGERKAFLHDMSCAASTSAKDVRVLRRVGPERLLDMALLVPRDRVPSLQDRLEAVAANAARLDVTCRLVGPGPTYSFCGEFTHDE